MGKVKVSMDLDEEYIWKSREYGAKNKIKRGFVGVVELALEELIPNIDSCKSRSGVGVISRLNKKEKEGGEE